MSKSSGMGDDGGLLRKVAEQRLVRRGVDWMRFFAQFMREQMRGWNKPFNNAVYSATGMVCAGQGTREMREVAILIDSSGSMSNTVVGKALDQTQHMMKTMRPKKTHVICCSTRVEPAKCRSYNANETIDRSIITGGGGTRFLPAFEYLRKHHPQVQVVVYITDGESSDRNTIPANLIPRKLLWVSYGLDATAYKIGEAVNAPVE